MAWLVLASLAVPNRVAHCFVDPLLRHWLLNLFILLKGLHGLMLLSLRKSVVAAFVLVFVFHIADNSFQYQRCLLKASNQRFPDIKVVEASTQCNGSADGGLFRLFPQPMATHRR